MTARHQAATSPRQSKLPIPRYPDTPIPRHSRPTHLVRPDELNGWYSMAPCAIHVDGLTRVLGLRWRWRPAATATRFPPARMWGRASNVGLATAPVFRTLAVMQKRCLTDTNKGALARSFTKGANGLSHTSSIDRATGRGDRSQTPLKTSSVWLAELTSILSISPLAVKGCGA